MSFIGRPLEKIDWEGILYYHRMGVASFQTGASRPRLRHNPLCFIVLALFLASVGPPYQANALKPYSTCRLNSRPGDSCPAVRRNNEGKCIAHAEFQQRGDDWCLLPLGDVSRERGQHLAALVARNQRRKRKGKYLEMMMERVNSPNVFRQAHDFHHYTIHKENTLGLHMVENSSNPFQGVHVPDEDIQSSFDFRTCAVVGSSDNLLATQYGMQIDNHTTIIRFNNAPTKGFELHVGSRTDIRITNSGFSFFSENGSRNPCRRVMISPQYEAYRRGLWGRLITGAHPNWSSGFMGIALALNLCGRVTIYGFSWSTSYYFQKVHLSSARRLKTMARQAFGSSNTHQWSFEHQCVHQFGDTNPCVTLRK